MRSEVEHHLLVPPSQNPGVGEGGYTGSDFDRAATSIVEDSVFESPTVDIPDPASDGAVDQSSPNEREDHGWNDAATFGSGPDNEGGGDGAELHLVEGVEEFGNQRRARRWLSERVHKTEMVEITYVSAGAGCAEGEGIAPEIPLEHDDAEGHHTHPYER